MFNSGQPVFMLYSVDLVILKLYKRYSIHLMRYFFPFHCYYQTEGEALNFQIFLINREPYSLGRDSNEHEHRLQKQDLRFFHQN